MSNFDILAPTNQTLMNQRNSLKSAKGGIFSIFLLLIIILAGIFLGKDALLQENPVIWNTFENSNPPKFKLADFKNCFFIPRSSDQNLSKWEMLIKVEITRNIFKNLTLLYYNEVSNVSGYFNVSPSFNPTYKYYCLDLSGSYEKFNDMEINSSLNIIASFNLRKNINLNLVGFVMSDSYFDQTKSIGEVHRNRITTYLHYVNPKFKYMNHKRSDIILRKDLFESQGLLGQKQTREGFSISSLQESIAVDSDNDYLAYWECNMFLSSETRFIKRKYSSLFDFFMVYVGLLKAFNYVVFFYQTIFMKSYLITLSEKMIDYTPNKVSENNDMSRPLNEGSKVFKKKLTFCEFLCINLKCSQRSKAKKMIYEKVFESVEKSFNFLFLFKSLIRLQLSQSQTLNLTKYQKIPFSFVDDCSNSDIRRKNLLELYYFRKNENNSQFINVTS
jgi:hypothetical protein